MNNPKTPIAELSYVFQERTAHDGGRFICRHDGTRIKFRYSGTKKSKQSSPAPDGGSKS